MSIEHSRLTSSIALCTYNGEKYLQEQLDSLASQTRLPDELVVCDDFSTDKTIEILEAFAKTAPFSVQLFQNEQNLGFNRNFENASLKCIMDVIFFCDQDDIWEPEKIQSYMELFESDAQTGFVISDSKINNESMVSLLISSGLLAKNFRSYALKSNFIPVACRYQSWSGHSIGFLRKYNRILFPLPAFILETNTYYDHWIFTILYSISSGKYIDRLLTNHRTHSQSAVSVENQRQISQMEQRVKEGKQGIKYIYECMSDVAQFYYVFIQKTEYNNPVNDMVHIFKCRSEHYLKRAMMRDSISNRLWYSICELFNGNYFRYSSGLLSFAKDILGK